MRTILKYAGTIALISLLSGSNGDVYSQSRKELEEKKKKTEQEIEYASQLLLETQKSKKETINKLRIISSRIELRNSLINSISKEINLLEDEILEKKKLVESLENDLKIVKQEYEVLIRYAYKNRNQKDKLMYVMAAESFNQAYKRIKYLQQFADHRKEQAMLILKMQEDIILEIEKLEVMVGEKESLIEKKKNENQQLTSEKSQSSRTVNNLAKEESEIKRKIKENVEATAKLEKEIAAIIEAEAKKASGNNIYRQLTPEERLISDNFQENRGRLPWPTERGIVTEKFGRHPHPVLKGIYVQNNGIDINTVSGAEARALFDGEVSKVIAILGKNYTVIIRHGNFLTVYQNLVDIKVKKGDKVKVKQVLGKVYTDTDSRNTILHIEIWKELTKQNPEEWLSSSVR